MKISVEEHGEKLNILTISGINTCDDNSMKSLKCILKILLNGDKFFFEFVSEDFFLTRDELVKYRSEVPQYLKRNGKYEVKFKLDETRFRSIGNLPVNEETYNQILILWKYFETLVFFNPYSTYSWQDFDEKIIRRKAEVPAIDFIEKKYTDSVLIKGHDGDNLIFIYDKGYDEAVIKDVISVVNKYYIHNL